MIEELFNIKINDLIKVLENSLGDFSEASSNYKDNIIIGRGNGYEFKFNKEIRYKEDRESLKKSLKEKNFFALGNNIYHIILPHTIFLFKKIDVDSSLEILIGFFLEKTLDTRHNIIDKKVEFFIDTMRATV